ncbi:MAG: hypothetical protein Ta2B_08160 [Termitinemataceae bacterium]|nr:MAG: hypothetical protein Ta2B_08160 [Termitinemataceae bacterium]
MCCPSCKVPIFSIPQCRRHSRHRDIERTNDGIARDIYGRPLQNLVRKNPQNTQAVNAIRNFQTKKD